MVGQIRLNTEVDIIPCALVASASTRGARVIIAGQCEGHSMVSVLPIMMAHTTIQRGHVKTQRQWANPKFLFGRVGGHDEQVSTLPTTLPNKNLGSQHM